MTNDTLYTPVAIALHWLSAVLVVALIAVGWYVSTLGITPLRLRLVAWHKWAGITLLTLTLIRLAWRLTHVPPPQHSSTPNSMLLVQRLVHALLYVLCVATPLVGWAYSSAAGFPVVLFGQFAVPDFVNADKELAVSLRAVHGLLAWSLGALVVLHIVAAFKHQFVDRDNLLSRVGLRTRSQ